MEAGNPATSLSHINHERHKIYNTHSSSHPLARMTNTVHNIVNTLHTDEHCWQVFRLRSRPPRPSSHSVCASSDAVDRSSSVTAAQPRGNQVLRSLNIFRKCSTMNCFHPTSLLSFCFETNLNRTHHTMALQGYNKNNRCTNGSFPHGDQRHIFLLL